MIAKYTSLNDRFGSGAVVAVVPESGRRCGRSRVVCRYWLPEPAPIIGAARAASLPESVDISSV